MLKLAAIAMAATTIAIASFALGLLRMRPFQLHDVDWQTLYKIYWVKSP